MKIGMSVCLSVCRIRSVNGAVEQRALLVRLLRPVGEAAQLLGVLQVLAHHVPEIFQEPASNGVSVAVAENMAPTMAPWLSWKQ